MSAVTSSSAAIRIAAPSPRVLRVVNPLVSAILRSPFYWLLSRNVLLLTFRGRQSGRSYTIPVNYTREGNTLTVFSTRAWWKNLRDNAAVAVVLGGRARAAHAEITDDRELVRLEVQRYIAQFGLRGAGARIGIAFDPSHPPSRDDLIQNLPHLAVIRLTLADGGHHP